jgi:xanthine dehydrogenase accessory factor
MIVFIRGGGDLASGVAMRLVRAGMQVVIMELDRPLAIRRKVCFAEAVYMGEVLVEDIAARLVKDPSDKLEVNRVLAQGKIAVLVDPEGEAIADLHCRVLVDGRMLKQVVPLQQLQMDLLVGLGPGFTAAVNCHAVVETQRGHTLGRVYWKGTGSTDSGIPDGVQGFTVERVLRAPTNGKVVPLSEIGDQVKPGQVVAEMEGLPVISPFKGVLRGLIHPDVIVPRGTKIGDVDPRNDPNLCFLVSDKSLAVGGGVLEAILTRPELRRMLWA